MLTPVSSDKSVSEKRAKTVDQPLFGLWNDREDVSDPGSYVRKLRENRSSSFDGLSQRDSRGKRRK